MAVSNTTTVKTIYQSLAGGLAPPAADLATYVALMATAGWTPAMVTAAIESEPFIQNVVNPIIREYQAAFGRVPDQAGLSYWIQQYAALDPTNARLTFAQLGTLSTTFTAAAEFTNRYGSTWTPSTLVTPANGSALVTALYTNILGRSPDTAGLNYWLNAKVTVSQLLTSFAQAAEFIADSAAAITVFENLEVTGALASVGSLLNLVPPVIQNIALTTGIDTVSISTNNIHVVGTFNGNAGAPSTYTAGDSILAANGLTGVAMTLSDQATGGVGNLGGVAATVSGVPDLTVFSGEAIRLDATASIAGFAGLTQLNATTSVTIGRDDTFTVSAATSVTVTDLGVSSGGFTGDITIYGGHNIAVTESGSAHSIYIGGSVPTASTVPTGTVTVNLTGAGDTGLRVNGGSAVTVNTSQTGGMLIGEFVAPTGAVTVTDAGAEAIYVLGGTSVTVASFANLAKGDGSGSNILVSGPTGAVVVNETAIVAGAIYIESGSSVALSTTGGDGANYNVGSFTTPIVGNVSVTNTIAGPSEDSIGVGTTGSVIINTSRTGVFRNGDTAGRIQVGNGTSAIDPTGTVTIVDATGTKYGAGNTAVYVNGSTLVSITGGGATTVSDDVAAGALAAVTLTGLQAGGASLNGNAITTLNLASSKASVTLNNLTAGHALTINVNAEGSNSTAAIITDDHATTITLVAAGVGNNVQLFDAVASGATALNVTNNGTGSLNVVGGHFGGAASEVVTVSGAGAVNLGTLGTFGPVKSITTTDTGGVTVTLNDGIAFNGGTTGNNVVTDNGNGAGLSSVVNGGTGGNNTIVMTAVAADYLAAPGLGITNFSTLAVGPGGAGAYDATVFTALVANASTGITFNNISAGTPITLRSSQPLQANTASGVTALSFNVGIAGSSTVAPTTFNNTVTVNTVNPGVATLNVNPVSQFGSTATQNLTIADATPTAPSTVTAINVTGSGSLALTYSTTVGGVFSVVNTINASGASAKVDTTHVVGATTGLTITGGSGTLTAFGSGLQPGAGQTAGSFIGAADTITSGSGGAKITVGYAQTSTINLAASAAKADTVTLAHLGINGGTALLNATVAGFLVTASSTTDDSLKFTDTVTLLGTSAAVLPTTGFGGSDTYTVSNGMIVFSGPDTIGQEIQDAQGIVGNGALATPNIVAAFSAGGNTYVFDLSDSNTGPFGYISLAGVTATQFGGANAAAGAVLSNTGATMVFTGASAASITTGASTITQNDSGYIFQTISGSGTAAVTVNNLAPSAIVSDSATGNYNLTTTQLGTAGSESLLLLISGVHTIPVLTVTGDNALTINPAAASAVTLLVDPGNTLASLTIGAGSAFTLGGFTDTALTKITLTDTGSVTLGSTGTPLAKAGLTVAIGSSTAATNADAAHLYLSGATAVVTAFDTNSGLIVSATGAGSSVTLSTETGNVVGTNQTITVGATGTVTLYQGTAAAAGVVQNDGGGNALITAGANSTITLGTDHSGNATDGFVTGIGQGGGSFIIITGDVTGTNSGGAYAMTTINNAVDNVTAIQFVTGSPAQHRVGFVNVGVATSLANALDVSAHYISTKLSPSAGDQSAGWFQYGGNTYVLSHTGGAETGLSAADSLVKLTGIVDLTHFNTASPGAFIL